MMRIYDTRRDAALHCSSDHLPTSEEQFAAAQDAKPSNKSFELCQTAEASEPSVEKLLAKADEHGDGEYEETDDDNDLGGNCPIKNFDELDEIWNPEEFNMKKAQKGKKMQIDKQRGTVNSENGFMSLVQDFRNRSKNEVPLSIGRILPELSEAKVLPGAANYPRHQLYTQFIVVLKGIGPETYRFLRDDAFNSNHPATTLTDLDLTRRYLKRLRRSRYDYVENRRQLMSKFKGHEPIDKSLVAIVEGLPLVYNSDRYTLKPWRQSSSQLRQSESDQLERFESGPDL